MRLCAVALAIALLVALNSCTNLRGLSGGLDPQFGSGGLVITDFNGETDEARAVVVQEDGKLVVGGITYISGKTDFALARYDASGALDLTFNSSGLVTTDFAGGNDVLRSLALQSDGKIVAVGHSTVGSNSRIAVARYLTDGNLDVTFGSSGILLQTIGDTTNEANSVAVQTDGAILILGTTDIASINRILVMRLLTNGSLDPAFAGIGYTTLSFGLLDDKGLAMALDNDGTIVVGGSSRQTTQTNFVFARYTTDGILDTTFASAGKRSVNIGAALVSGTTSPATPTTDTMSGLLILTSGNIIATGTSNAGTRNDFAVLALTARGSVQETFGFKGVILRAFGEGEGNSVAYGSTRLALDSFLLGGYFDVTGFPDFALAKYDEQGNPVINFGVSGTAMNDFNNSPDECFAVAAQSDDRVVAVGRTFSGNQWDFAVVRYQ